MELWELVKGIEPIELLKCGDCPHRMHRCPRPDENQPDDPECSPRTSERQALLYLEREQKSHGQREMFGETS